MASTAARTSPQMSAAENQLLERLRSGHPDACGEVARRITPVIRSGLYSSDDFEDVLQQCILEVLEVLRSVSTVRNLWGLVRRIAVTTVIDHNRALVRRRRRDGDSVAGEADPLASVPDHRPGPDATLGDRDLVLYVFQRLDEACRQIVQLVFLKELTYSTAAAELGLSEGALRVRIHRCRKEAIRIRDETLSSADRR